MIRYLQNIDIDRYKWDSCNDEAVNGMVYSASWYLDIVCGNWEALVEDDYRSIFPLSPGKKFGINYLFQPVFTQQLGLISKNRLSEERVEDFLKCIPLKYRFVEMNLNTFNKVNSGQFKSESWHNFELDLIAGYPQISKNYSENLKRNLKKAEKAGLTIVKNIKPDDVITLFRNNRGREIKSLRDNEFAVLNRLSYEGIYKGKILTAGVYSGQNELIAGAIFLKSNGRIIFLFSGLSGHGRESAAMPMLIDSVIKENSHQQLTFDFEGSNDPNLARFYQSFGSKRCIYPHLTLNRLPFVTRVAVNSAKWFKNKI